MFHQPQSDPTVVPELTNRRYRARFRNLEISDLLDFRDLTPLGEGPRGGWGGCPTQKRWHFIHK